MKTYSIYRITNKLNNKIYIGYTSNKEGHRFKGHCSTTKPKYQDRSIISLAIEKYGKENFIVEVIYQSKDYEHCRKIESHFIKENNSLTHTQGGHGYNIDAGGTGHKRSPETIEKHRQKIKGRPQSEEHKKKKADAIRGEKNGMFKIPKELHPMFGKPVSEKTRKKISDSKKGAIAWNKGKSTGPLSEEHRRKLREAKPSKYSLVVIETPTGDRVTLKEKEILNYLRKKNLNNFMSKMVKNSSKPIKGYRLLEFNLN